MGYSVQKPVSLPFKLVKERPVMRRIGSSALVGSKVARIDVSKGEKMAIWEIVGSDTIKVHPQGIVALKFFSEIGHQLYLAKLKRDNVSLTKSPCRGVVLCAPVHDDSVGRQVEGSVGRKLVNIIWRANTAMREPVLLIHHNIAEALMTVDKHAEDFRPGRAGSFELGHARNRPHVGGGAWRNLCHDWAVVDKDWCGCLGLHLAGVEG